jgi:hypothetical protein
MIPCFENCDQRIGRCDCLLPEKLAKRVVRCRLIFPALPYFCYLIPQAYSHMSSNMLLWETGFFAMGTESE